MAKSFRKRTALAESDDRQGIASIKNEIACIVKLAQGSELGCSKIGKRPHMTIEVNFILNILNIRCTLVHIIVLAFFRM